jgi:hypothetical protein
MGLPALAQVTGGHDTVQDAIRFERQKDAADARQARIEARRAGNSSADREDNSGGTATRTTKSKTTTKKSNSAARKNTTPQQ